MVKNVIEEFERALKICESTDSYREYFSDEDYTQKVDDRGVDMMRLGFIKGQLKGCLPTLKKIQKEMEKQERQIDILFEYISDNDLDEVEQKLDEVEDDC